MKVDITLTVGGNDVTIDYEEVRKLFIDLISLFEPGSKKNTAYSIYDEQQSLSCDKNKSKEPAKAKISEDTVKAIQEIKDLADPEFVNPEELDTIILDDNIDTEIVDIEIADRMKQMQKIIDKMQK